MPNTSSANLVVLFTASSVAIYLLCTQLGADSDGVLAAIFLLGLTVFLLKVKSVGAGGAEARRDDSPVLYWSMVIVIAALAIIFIDAFIDASPTQSRDGNVSPACPEDRF